MTNVLDILEAHGCFISNADEATMNTRFENIGIDFADLAMRTCQCGVRLDGFDDYHSHLRTMIEESIE